MCVGPKKIRKRDPFENDSSRPVTYTGSSTRIMRQRKHSHIIYTCYVDVDIYGGKSNTHRLKSNNKYKLE